MNNINKKSKTSWDWDLDKTWDKVTQAPIADEQVEELPQIFSTPEGYLVLKKGLDESEFGILIKTRVFKDESLDNRKMRFIALVFESLGQNAYGMTARDLFEVYLKNQGRWIAKEGVAKEVGEGLTLREFEAFLNTPLVENYIQNKFNDVQKHIKRTLLMKTYKGGVLSSSETNMLKLFLNGTNTEEEIQRGDVYVKFYTPRYTDRKDMTLEELNHLHSAILSRLEEDNEV
ncbi:MAG: hypothetical protein ACRCXT_23770 [Paraclostridium sp.]